MVELRSLKTLIIIKKRAVHVAKTLQNLVQCFWGGGGGGFRIKTNQKLKTVLSTF